MKFDLQKTGKCGKYKRDPAVAVDRFVAAVGLKRRTKNEPRLAA